MTMIKTDAVGDDVDGTPGNSRGIHAFAVEGADYYEAEFERIEGRTGFVFSWNWAAAALGPIWGTARGAWGFYWIFLILELFALVQIGPRAVGRTGCRRTGALQPNSGERRKPGSTGGRTSCRGRDCGCRRQPAHCGQPACCCRNRARGGKRRKRRGLVNSALRPSVPCLREGRRRTLRKLRLRGAVPAVAFRQA